MPPSRAPLRLLSVATARWRLVAALRLLTLLGPAAIAQAQCEPPLYPHTEAAPAGGVVVRWFHPDIAADTITASNRPYHHGFFIGTVLPEPQIAFRLSGGEGARLIRRISAYVVGSEGISADQWSRNAAFVWSLHADQDGYPGSVIGPDVVWQLGDIPDLRLGSWFRDDIAWIVGPDHEVVWLVGSWPDAAAAIVQLGADDSSAVLPTLVGSDPDWQQIWSPGILVELVTLAADADTTLASVGETTAGESLGFAVVTEVVGGPFPAGADAAIVLPENGLRFVDSLAAVGQVRQYHVQTRNGPDTSEWVTTEPHEVAAHWPLALIPESLTALVYTGWEAPLEVVFRNDGETSLEVWIDTPMELSNIDLAAEETASGYPLRVDPDSLTLAGGQAQPILIVSAAEAPEPGAFAGFLRFRVGAADSPFVDNRLIAINLQVDAVTAVGEPGDDAASRENRGLIVRPLTSPFGDQIRLSVELDPNHNSEATHRLGSAGDADRLEVVVYDILGRERARSTFPMPFHATGAEPVSRDLTISATGSWSSGVYFCGVRWGPYRRVVKLLHLR